MNNCCYTSIIDKRCFNNYEAYKPSYSNWCLKGFSIKDCTIFFKEIRTWFRPTRIWYSGCNKPDVSNSNNVLYLHYNQIDYVSVVITRNCSLCIVCYILVKWTERVTSQQNCFIDVKVNEIMISNTIHSMR